MDGVLDASARFDVAVIYNGLERKIAVARSELVRVLREQALRVFGITQNQHTFGLFTERGAELPEDKTIEQAAIRPHERLLLRPRVIQGG